MLYLFTAIYCEAKPIIEHFHLEKDLSFTHFQVFQNDHMKVIITGEGKVASAVAVSHIFTMYEPDCDDYLINIGCCGAEFSEKVVKTVEGSQVKSVHMLEIGNIVICNKITDIATGFTYFPDMLYQHEFIEAEIVTSDIPYPYGESTPLKNANMGTRVFDMEASAIYQAASYYIGPHQMSFIKIVSDHGIKQSEENGLRKLNSVIDHDDITNLIRTNMKSICNYLRELQQSTYSDTNQEEEKEQEIVEKLSIDLHCSIVMKNQLNQLLTYCRLSNIDYESAIKHMVIDGVLPCHDKKEGKIRFEQLKYELLQ